MRLLTRAASGTVREMHRANGNQADLEARHGPWAAVQGFSPHADCAAPATALRTAAGTLRARVALPRRFTAIAPGRPGPGRWVPRANAALPLCSTSGFGAGI